MAELSVCAKAEDRSYRRLNECLRQSPGELVRRPPPGAMRGDKPPNAKLHHLANRRWNDRLKQASRQVKTANEAGDRVQAG